MILLQTKHALLQGLNIMLVTEYFSPHIHHAYSSALAPKMWMCSGVGSNRAVIAVELLRVALLDKMAKWLTESLRYNSSVCRSVKEA